mgnify:CR=1 FL=1
MAYSERELLARIVQCEAGGEGQQGMMAVASVIMNRVNVPEGEYARISRRPEALEISYISKDNLIVYVNSYMENIIPKIYII